MNWPQTVIVAQTVHICEHTEDHCNLFFPAGQMTELMVTPTPETPLLLRSPAHFRTRTLWRWYALSTYTAGLHPGLTHCLPSTSSLPLTAARCRKQSWHAWPTLCFMWPICTGSWWKTLRGGPLWLAVFSTTQGSTTPTSMWRHLGIIRYVGTPGTPESHGVPYRGT